MSVAGKFELTDGDFYAISLAIDTARSFLKLPGITPLQVIGIGNALYALERLPLATPGAYAQFGIEYCAGKEGFKEKQYILFTIAEDYFEITQGGREGDKSAGDSGSGPRWIFMADGYRDEQCDLYEIEASISECLERGAAITVTDESDIVYEADDSETYGEQDDPDDEYVLDENDSCSGQELFQYDDGLVNVTVSREEVERKNIQPVLSVLGQFTGSPQIARANMEKVDISFAGFDQDARDLFEIPEVRDYVHLLDEHFPYWLFFLAKDFLSLQCITFCFLPPYLTDREKAMRHSKQLQELFVNRWLPAMKQISQYAGLDEDEIEELTDRARMYLTEGPLEAL